MPTHANSPNIRVQCSGIAPVIISHATLLQVEGHVEDAKAKGAKILTGGGRPKLTGELEKGYFFEPTVISDASTDMKIFKEETFGPAIPCFRFEEDSEAIELANDTEYGLAAYFYTKVSIPFCPALKTSSSDSSALSLRHLPDCH